MNGELQARLAAVEMLYNILKTRVDLLEETVRQAEQQLAELRGSLNVG